MEKINFIESNCALMGSPFTIQVYAEKEKPIPLIKGLIQLAFGEIRRIENQLTDFKPSPFNHINEMAGKEPVHVSDEIWNVIEMALRISRDSQGAFDISTATIGHLWRRAMEEGSPPSQKTLQHAKAFVNFRHIQLDREKRTVYLPYPEMRIGLGGIGKGYAVDQAYDFLRKSGLENVCVNGAGDIRVHSAPDAPRPWRIGVRNPLAEKNHAMGLVNLSQGAIATSGDYERFFRYQGKKYHHIFDGRTGEMTEEVISATVLAPTATQADVMATTAMTLGRHAGIDYLKRHRHVSGFLVTQSGEVINAH